MKNIPLQGMLCTMVFVLTLSQATAIDLKRGKKLHDGNCTSCHISKMGGDGSKIYTRSDRRIDSLSSLDQQVKRCKNNIGTSWPDDQVNDVVHFLDKQYYKFSK